MRGVYNLAVSPAVLDNEVGISGGIDIASAHSLFEGVKTTRERTRHEEGCGDADIAEVVSHGVFEVEVVYFGGFAAGEGFNVIKGGSDKVSNPSLL
jgi:hypothetical protein